MSLGWDGEVADVGIRNGELVLRASPEDNAIRMRISQAAEESVHTCANCGSRSGERLSGVTLCGGCRTWSPGPFDWARWEAAAVEAGLRREETQRVHRVGVLGPERKH
jgi:hypothetical protein